MTNGDPKLWIRQHLGSADIAIDIGAGMGEEAEIMAVIVGPLGKVYSWEPDSRRQAGLMQLHAIYKHMHLLPYCAGAGLDAVPFFEATNPDHSSLWRMNAMANDASNVQTSLEVSQLPLDAVITRADLVKIDVRGAECAVLRGAKQLLRTCPTWIVECWPTGLQRAGESADTLRTLLLDAGLVITSGNGGTEPVTDDAWTRWLAQASSRETSCINLLARRAA